MKQKQTETNRNKQKQVELICVEGDGNHNKIYKMIDLENNTFKSTWGRVGASFQEQIYEMSLWDKKYKEKLKKGYIDVTSYKSQIVTSDGKIATIHPLLEILQKYATNKISDNYLVVSDNVTKQQVDKAQEIIDLLVNTKTVNSFNLLLKELYTVIPRKMKKVQDYFISNIIKKEIDELINNEQQLLDVMRQQVSMHPTKTDSTTSLESKLGLVIEEITNDDKKIIMDMLQQNKNQFKTAYKITNNKTKSEFTNNKNHSHKQWTKLLWHGSRNENWLNIISVGLLIRPSGVALTGAMFGNGIYFADKVKKSIGYTSINGSYWAKGGDDRAFLAIYEVNTGMELRTKNRKSYMSSLSYDKLQKQGNYDSLFAEGGIDLINNEYIIYKPQQCTIRYIVEIGK